MFVDVEGVVLWCCGGAVVIERGSGNEREKL